jgi:microcin C transport system substrate-binding protein
MIGLLRRRAASRITRFRRWQAAVRPALGMAAVVVALCGVGVAWAEPQHGIAMHGAPKYAAGFAHLDYVNPAAPKGGELRRALTGTFDSLNPFIIKGVAARGRHLVFESLLKRTWDEPFSLYGLIAETIEVPDDRASVTFSLRPEARFHDGRPITVDDVVFSWETLKARGRPNHRLYYRQVVRVERPGPRAVRFVFDAESPDRELPLILGLMPILSKAYYADQKFEQTTLDPPLGSGPYRVAYVDPGRAIVYARYPDYWGQHLPINRGQHNFARIRYDYFRDANVMMEAFRAGEYGFRAEYAAARWATDYDFPAVADGRVQLERLAHGRPSGMLGMVFNTRREIFADRAVREALSHAFDFEWVNKTLLQGAYVRTHSIWDNSELASHDLPAGHELALLEPFRERLPAELFDRPYRPPGVAGGLRANLRAARQGLAEAGWAVRGGRLERTADAHPMAFEILLVRPENEKIALAFTRNLERLGVEARVRTVDTAQYQYRRNAFDFDMIFYHWDMSLSPGNEQAYYWTSAAADQEATRNYPGVRDPVVDHLIERMTEARDRADFVATIQALDRVLLWGHYVVPLYHLNDDRVAYRNKLARPAVTPLYGYVLEAWWRHPAQAPRERPAARE